MGSKLRRNHTFSLTMGLQRRGSRPQPHCIAQAPTFTNAGMRRSIKLPHLGFLHFQLREPRPYQSSMGWKPIGTIWLSTRMTPSTDLTRRTASAM